MKKLSILAVCSYLFALLIIPLSSMHREDFSADYALIFLPDTADSGTSDAVAEAAARLYHSGRVRSVLVVASENRHKLMQALLARDITADDLSIVAGGGDLKQAAGNAISATGRFHSVVAVDASYRIPRARLMLQQAGFDEVYGYPADLALWPQFLAVHHELPRLAGHWLKAGS